MPRLAPSQFFEGLAGDNSKAHWETHRDAYQRFVRASMEQLLEELEPEFGGGRIFRPYRDVRFSNDKSPYKTNIAAMVGDMGYVSFEATGLGVTAASSTWHRTSSTATGRRSQGYAKDHPRIDPAAVEGRGRLSAVGPGGVAGNGEAKVRVVEALRAAGPLRRA